MERLGERSRNGPIGPAEAMQPIRDRHIYVILIVCISKSKRGLKKHISSSIYITNFVTTVVVMTL